jgi:hypothetical protein
MIYMARRRQLRPRHIIVGEPPFATTHDGFVSIDKLSTMTIGSKVTTASSTLLAELAERGWAYHVAENADPAAVLGEVGRIGDLLGERVAGRAGALEEVVRPQAMRPILDP